MSKVERDGFSSLLVTTVTGGSVLTITDGNGGNNQDGYTKWGGCGNHLRPANARCHRDLHSTSGLVPVPPALGSVGLPDYEKLDGYAHDCESAHGGMLDFVNEPTLIAAKGAFPAPD